MVEKSHEVFKQDSIRVKDDQQDSSSLYSKTLVNNQQPISLEMSVDYFVITFSPHYQPTMLEEC